MQHSLQKPIIIVIVIIHHHDLDQPNFLWIFILNPLPSDFCDTKNSPLCLILKEAVGNSWGFCIWRCFVVFARPVSL